VSKTYFRFNNHRITPSTSAKRRWRQKITPSTSVQ